MPPGAELCPSSGPEQLLGPPGSGTWAKFRQRGEPWTPRSRNLAQVPACRRPLGPPGAELGPSSGNEASFGPPDRGTWPKFRTAGDVWDPRARNLDQVPATRRALDPRTRNFAQVPARRGLLGFPGRGTWTKFRQRAELWTRRSRNLAQVLARRRALGPPGAELEPSSGNEASFGPPGRGTCPKFRPRGELWTPPGAELGPSSGTGAS